MSNSNGNTFSFIHHVCYFSYRPWIAPSEGRSLTTQEHQHPCPILLEFHHSSLPLCKNHKKLEVDKKIQACEAVTLTENFVFSLCRSSKPSVFCLLTLQSWSKHFIRWSCFQICSGSNNTSLLYACEVIHLIKRV